MLSVLARYLQQSSYLFASWLSFSEEHYFSKASIALENSLRQVSVASNLCCLWLSSTNNLSIRFKYRVQASEVKTVFLDDQPTGWTIGWNRFYDGRGNSIAAGDATKSHWQLWPLLFWWFEWFGKWSISNASSIVVKFNENDDYFPWITIKYISFAAKRFPFDTDSSPIGYLIGVISEYVIFGYEYCVIACSLALGMGIFWFAISVTKEIQHTLHSINRKTRANKLRPNQMKILFMEFIHAHAAIKRYAFQSFEQRKNVSSTIVDFRVLRNVSNIFQPILMSLFTWSLLAISGALLMIQVELV